MPDWSSTLPPQQPSAGKRIFVGPQGVRAGWRLLMFLFLVVIMLGVAWLARPLLRLLVPHPLQSPTADGIAKGVFLVPILLTAAGVMGWFEHRSLAEYGLPLRQLLGKEFWTGALWGIVMVSVVIAMMAACHVYSPGTLALSPLKIAVWGILNAIFYLMLALSSEFFFFGYVQFTLTTGMGFWPAAALVTCVYSEIWMLPHDWTLIGPIFMLFFLYLALCRTGNLWFGIGWFAAFDWGATFLYSTSQDRPHVGRLLNASLTGSNWLTGGYHTPEASVFGLMVLVVGTVLLAKLYPDAKYPALSIPSSALGGVSDTPVRKTPIS